MIRLIRIATLALAALALLASPIAISPVEAARKGKLTDAQKDHFKQTKRDYRKQERDGLAVTRPLWPKFKKTKRELDRASYAANNSRANLNKLKAKVDAQRQNERGLAALLGDNNMGSDKLRRMEKLYQRAEAYHNRTAKAQYDAAQAAYLPVAQAFNAAKAQVDDARSKLATRKNEKNAARAANLQAAIDAKAAKKLAKQRKGQPQGPLIGLNASDFPAVPQGNATIGGGSFGGASLPMPNSQTFAAFSAPRFTPISAPPE
jgi:hypothetical protein